MYGLKAKYDAIATTVDMQVKVFQAETTAAIEEEKLRVSAQTSIRRWRRRLPSPQSSLHAQVMASGLSAMRAGKYFVQPWNRTGCKVQLQLRRVLT